MPEGVSRRDFSRIETNKYIGRFAPSPTGPLHFGSAVAAIASFLDARSQDGIWLVRIEDLDPPREQPGAAKKIVDALSVLHLTADQPIQYQSERHDLYRRALGELRSKKSVFDCGCTKREIGYRAYPGTCRQGLPAGKIARSQRFIVPEEEIKFEDLCYGLQVENLTETVGDFNLVRADGLFSYHLAVVVDDAEQGITHVVRGSDLLSSTARQIALQHALGYQTPNYLHFPVVEDADGVKLSKQTGAKEIDVSSPQEVWMNALEFLKQPTLDSCRQLPLSQLIAKATENWDPSRVTKI